MPGCGILVICPERFPCEESSITDIQSAIRAGRATCKDVVQAYIDRAKAYNGVCTELVTNDGMPIPPSTEILRAGAPIKYPTGTVAASTVFPDLDKYQGLPLELGKMMQSVPIQASSFNMAGESEFPTRVR